MRFEHCGGDRWERRRERGRGRHGRRKERILHTRISDQLSEDIRRVAEDLRVPVSNLVRNVLEEVFSVVEQMSDDVGELFEDVVDEAEQARERLQRFHERQQRRRSQREARRAREETDADAPSAPPPPPAEREDREERTEPAASGPESFREVLAWQRVLLNSTQRCAATGRELEPGEEAYVGITEQGLSGHYLSREAMEQRGVSD